MKGYPLHVVVDTFEDLKEAAVPVHRAYCKVKLFKDKVQDVCGCMYVHVAPLVVGSGSLSSTV